jgi:hypothetical protein
MDTMTIPTQAPAIFAVPRHRITSWAGATLQGTGVPTPRMSSANAAKNAAGDGATGDRAFEDPV